MVRRGAGVRIPASASRSCDRRNRRGRAGRATDKCQLPTTSRTCFASATQILDYYHASQHVVALAKAVYADAGSAQNWGVRWKALIYDSELDTVLAEARQASGGTLSAEAQREADYLENNRARMDYRRYRANGWFIGSGVVEAGCKHLVGQRLKQSGMFWTEAGATAVLHLRCALLSAGGWNHLWSQLLSHAA